MLAASVALPLLLFCYVAGVNYHAAFERADERIKQALDLSTEHALRVFRSINVTFDSVEQITRGRTEQTIRLNEAELSERLKQFVGALPDITSIWILNAHGDAIASSLLFPIPPEANAPDRAYLKAQLARDPNIHIGEALRIQLRGRLIIPASKWRMDSSGTFSGFTEISISPEAFERFYEPLAKRTSASFALIREDGAVLARYPAPPMPGIKLDASTGFIQLVARSPQGGEYTSISGIDQRERRISARRLGEFPVYVTSSLETQDIIQGWLWTMASHLVFGVPATAFFVVLILLAMKRTNDLYAEAELREAAEASLRQSQKMEAVGQLTGGVAHDFNNLLTIILGNLELALRQASEGRQRTLLTRVHRAAERAAELTKRLLAFSRNQPLDPRPIDANRLVADMSDLLGRTLGENISIETIRGGGLWQTEVDRAELESAMLNLAINARDAMQAGGKLTIETGNASLDEAYCATADGVKPGQYVMIAISDTGIGMSPELVGKAFDPFFTTKPAGSGTGLGLSQVEGFVRQSGGHVRIYSEVGEGTTVKIYLPRSFANSRPAASEAKAPESPMGSLETVLVVEDDAEVRSFVTDTLRRLNYRVLEAADGDGALVLVRQKEPIDLLLTDVVMPGMNGRALGDAAKHHRPELKVLYMTGYSRNAIVHQGRLDPGVSLIQKPFSESALASRVHGLLSTG